MLWSGVPFSVEGDTGGRNPREKGRGQNVWEAVKEGVERGIPKDAVSWRKRKKLHNIAQYSSKEKAQGGSQQNMEQKSRLKGSLDLSVPSIVGSLRSGRGRALNFSLVILFHSCFQSLFLLGSLYSTALLSMQYCTIDSTFLPLSTILKIPIPFTPSSLFSLPFHSEWDAN